MVFLAPVTEFGSDASISLVNSQAMQEVFNPTGPDAGEMLLYNGSTQVADLHLSGQSQFYASNQPASGGHTSSVLITAYDTGHSNPITHVRYAIWRRPLHRRPPSKVWDMKMAAVFYHATHPVGELRKRPCLGAGV
jgi:hypothetical protein